MPMTANPHSISCPGIPVSSGVSLGGQPLLHHMHSRAAESGATILPALPDIRGPRCSVCWADRQSEACSPHRSTPRLHIVLEHRP